MNKVKEYTQPEIHDIKPNGGNHSHPGNKRYVEIIRKNKLAYVLADAKGKRAVIKDVYNTLLPGRFLNKEKDGKFSVKDNKSSLGKIKKALSENNAKIVESLDYRGKWPRTNSVKSMIGPGTIQERKKCTIKPRERQKRLWQKSNNKQQLSSASKVTREDWVKLVESLKRKSR
jgi:hypothetical protein